MRVQGGKGLAVGCKGRGSPLPGGFRESGISLTQCNGARCAMGCGESAVSPLSRHGVRHPVNASGRLIQPLSKSVSGNGFA
jgi:hypothetical protein